MSSNYCSTPCRGASGFFFCAYSFPPSVGNVYGSLRANSSKCCTTLSIVETNCLPGSTLTHCKERDPGVGHHLRRSINRVVRAAVCDHHSNLSSRKTAKNHSSGWCDADETKPQLPHSSDQIEKDQPSSSSKASNF